MRKSQAHRFAHRNIQVQSCLWHKASTLKDFKNQAPEHIKLVCAKLQLLTSVLWFRFILINLGIKEQQTEQLAVDCTWGLRYEHSPCYYLVWFCHLSNARSCSEYQASQYCNGEKMGSGCFSILSTAHNMHKPIIWPLHTSVSMSTYRVVTTLWTKQTFIVLLQNLQFPGSHKPNDKQKCLGH